MATRKARIPKQDGEALKAVNLEATLPIRPKALVFISHDSRDADIAEAFANLLSDVSAGTLKSFRSSDKKGNTGIEFGAEWYTSIMSQLGDATDVVALLTARSIDRPWILYEAGVARGKLDTTVLGLALGVPLEKISTGPFGQFQNCGDDEDSLTKLVMQLLQRNPDAAPREEAVRMQVRLFIQSLKSILENKPKKETPEIENEDQNVAKLFEEVKAMVREIPQKIDAQVRIASRKTGSKNFRRFGPGVFDEILYRTSKLEGKNSVGTALLVILSFVKDDAPWLYELGMQIYRSMSAGDKNKVIEIHKQIHMTMEFMVMGPLGHDLYRDEEESFMMLRFIPEVIDRIVFGYLESTPVNRNKLKSATSSKGTENS